MIQEILRPTSVAEAVRVGSEKGSAFLGGGTWLVQQSSLEKSTVKKLISLEHLDLAAVETTNDSCRIGASVTFQELLDHADVPAGLASALRSTASRTIRSMATLGGELGLADPASVLIPVLVALDAGIIVPGTDYAAGTNRAPSAPTAGIEDSLTVAEYCGIDLEDAGSDGSGMSRRRDLILAVVIPNRDRPCAVETLSRTSHSEKTLVVAASPSDEGYVLVVSDCRGRVLRIEGAVPEQIPNILLKRFRPSRSIHASAKYKSYMADVFAEDLLRRLQASEGRS